MHQKKGECLKLRHVLFFGVCSAFETESYIIHASHGGLFFWGMVLGWASRSRWQHRARTMKIPNPLEEEETVTALIELEPKPLQVEMASGWRLNLETSSSPSFRDAILFWLVMCPHPKQTWSFGCEELSFVADGGSIASPLSLQDFVSNLSASSVTWPFDGGFRPFAHQVGSASDWSGNVLRVPFILAIELGSR